MTRTLAASVNSYTAQPTVTLFTLAELSLVGGTLRVFNGAGYLYTGVNTYTGIGDFGGVEPIKEDAGNFPSGLKMWISAVNSSALYEAVNERLFNRDVKLYRCWYNPASLAIVNTPELWFRGRINETTLFRGDAERGDYLEMVLRNKLRRESKASYYTTEDMLAGPYSGDTFFTHTSKISGFKALWGQKPTYFTNGGGAFATDPGPWEDLIRARWGL